MDHIKDLLEKYLQKKEIGKFLSQEKTKEQEIFYNWHKIIGEKYEKFTEPYKIFNKKLFIYVENSVIISELIYEKKKIIEKIKKEFSLSLKDIVFKIRQ
ncbi:MAG: DUF721 domain-containing protein [Candidatus Goldbacteria bacterium]|nr:DUF721 domain-containing protein [Candidatus Goldiibacteriota bacterium]